MKNPDEVLLSLSVSVYLNPNKAATNVTPIDAPIPIMKIDPTCTKASSFFAADEAEGESRNCKKPLSSSVLLCRRLEEEEGLGSPKRVVSFVRTFQK